MPSMWNAFDAIEETPLKPKSKNKRKSPSSEKQQRSKGKQRNRTSGLRKDEAKRAGRERSKKEVSPFFARQKKPQQKAGAGQRSPKRGQKFLIKDCEIIDLEGHQELLQQFLSNFRRKHDCAETSLVSRSKLEEEQQRLNSKNRTEQAALQAKGRQEVALRVESKSSNRKIKLTPLRVKIILQAILRPVELSLRRLAFYEISTCPAKQKQVADPERRKQKKQRPAESEEEERVLKEQRRLVIPQKLKLQLEQPERETMQKQGHFEAEDGVQSKEEEEERPRLRLPPPLNLESVSQTKIEEIAEQIKQIQKPHLIRKIYEAIPFAMPEPTFSLLQQSVEEGFQRQQRVCGEKFREEQRRAEREFRQEQDRLGKEACALFLDLRVLSGKLKLEEGREEAGRERSKGRVDQVRRVEQEIQARKAVQSGESSPPQHGISTDLFSVNNLVLCLYNFIDKHYRTPFLELINSSYGLNSVTRLARLQGRTYNLLDQPYEGFDSVSEILGDSILLQFQKLTHSLGSEEFKEAQHWHNKAVFDAFNKGLNFYRPYYSIEGEPYLWTVNEKGMNYYQICEENMDQVFEKTKQKIMESCCYLVGLHLPTAPDLLPQQLHPGVTILRPAHPRLSQRDADLILKMAHEEHAEREAQFLSTEEERTLALLDLAKGLETALLQELIFELEAQK